MESLHWSLATAALVPHPHRHSTGGRGSRLLGLLGPGGCICTTSGRKGSHRLKPPSDGGGWLSHSARCFRINVISGFPEIALINFRLGPRDLIQFHVAMERGCYFFSFNFIFFLSLYLAHSLFQGDWVVLITPSQRALSEWVSDWSRVHVCVCLANDHTNLAAKKPGCRHNPPHLFLFWPAAKAVCSKMEDYW